VLDSRDPRGQVGLLADPELDTFVTQAEEMCA
jgi:hypothetical protein